jgi:hypothetical protein
MRLSQWSQTAASFMHGSMHKYTFQEIYIDHHASSFPAQSDEDCMGRADDIHATEAMFQGSPCAGPTAT